MLNCYQGRELYPLENQLRIMAKGTSIYVIGLLDCCREKLAVRGGAGQVAEDGLEEGENLILAFGCPPSRYTAASSTLAKDFFRFLVDDADS